MVTPHWLRLAGQRTDLNPSPQSSILRQIVAGPRLQHPEANLDLCYVTDNSMFVDLNTCLQKLIHSSHRYLRPLGDLPPTSLPQSPRRPRDFPRLKTWLKLGHLGVSRRRNWIP